MFMQTCPFTPQTVVKICYFWFLLGLSVNRLWGYLNNHGTGFLCPNQTNNSFGTQSKLKLTNSNFEFADELEKHSTSFQHLACRDRTICGSLFRYFRSKLSRLTDRHDPKTRFPGGGKAPPGNGLCAHMLAHICWYSTKQQRRLVSQSVCFESLGMCPSGGYTSVKRWNTVQAHYLTTSMRSIKKGCFDPGFLPFSLSGANRNKLAQEMSILQRSCTAIDSAKGNVIASDFIEQACVWEELVLHHPPFRFFLKTGHKFFCFETGHDFFWNWTWKPDISKAKKRVREKKSVWPLVEFIWRVAAPELKPLRLQRAPKLLISESTLIRFSNWRSVLQFTKSRRNLSRAIYILNFKPNMSLRLGPCGRSWRKMTPDSNSTGWWVVNFLQWERALTGVHISTSFSGSLVVHHATMDRKYCRTLYRENTQRTGNAQPRTKHTAPSNCFEGQNGVPSSEHSIFSHWHGDFLNVMFMLPKHQLT